MQTKTNQKSDKTQNMPQLKVFCGKRQKFVIIKNNIMKKQKNS